MKSPGGTSTAITGANAFALVTLAQEYLGQLRALSERPIASSVRHAQ